MSLGENIRMARKNKGYSIMKVRELTGLSKSTISDLENDNSSPTAETLQKIASALGVPVEEFFKSKQISKENLRDLDEEYNKNGKLIEEINEIERIDPELFVQMCRAKNLPDSERKKIKEYSAFILDKYLKENKNQE